MRYYYTADTLFVRGKFHAASTGVAGGIADVSTIFNHTVPLDFSHENPIEYVVNILRKKKYGDDAFGMLTAVSIQDLCILQFDYITVFVTASVSNPNPDPAKLPTINIIVISSEGLSDAATLEMIITVTEAKAQALKLLGRDFAGTTSEAVVVASERVGKQIYAGTFTEAEKRVYSAVIKGVMEAVQRHEGTMKHHGPSYFVYSRYNQTGWFEWIKDSCPYYPCHFTGQVCQFCYCPFYPCMDETLGEWVENSVGDGKVWACTNCLLLHRKETAKYLMKHPDAGFEEIRNLKF